MSFYTWHGDSVYLSILVQPRASQTAWVGEHGEQIKLRVAAPPVDGQANQAIQVFLAKQFGVAKSSIRLLKGSHSRQKCFSISSPSKLPSFIEQSA